MGVVIKQSFWISVIGYIGVVAGYVSTLVLRPMYMTEGEIGLANLVISNGMLLIPMVSLGMPGTYLRLVHQIADTKSEKENLFTFQFTIVILANLVLLGLICLFLPQIKNLFVDKSELYNKYIFISFLILLFQSLFNFLNAYSRVKLDNIIPEFLKNVFLRLANITLILLFGFGLISFDWMVKSLSIIYGLSVLLLLGFLILKYDFRFVIKFRNLGEEIKTEMFKFGANLLLVAFGGTVASQIFFLLVSIYIGLDANGIFTTCFYIATVIEMPKRSMLQVIVPIFAREFKYDNIAEINKLYKKSSLTLSVAAILILLGVICNIDDLFYIIPKGESFREGIMVVILISSAKVIDLIFGFNSEVINYSRHYRSLLWFTMLYAIITLITCFLLIPAFGIDGAAWSFLISILVYNITKHLYLRSKLNISPFGKDHLKLITLAVFIYLACYHIPFGLGPLLNIIAKSILITLIYSLIVYYLKISTDINKLVDQIIHKLFKFNT